MDPITTVVPSANTLLNTGNIAITVLVSVVIMQWSIIWYLLKQHFITVQEAKNTLAELQKTLVILAERLRSHHD